MDGYALRAQDAARELTVVGESRAGRGWPEAVSAGHAVRIFTGAPVPAGANAVVEQERVTSVASDRIRLDRPLKPGWNVMPRGHEYRQGETVIARGTRLDALRLALSAATGHAALTVVEPPAILLGTSGDELTAPGQPLRPDHIYDVNGPLFEALLAQWGARVHRQTIADDPQALLRFFRSAADAGYDLVVTTGGASVGRYDYIPQIFAEHFDRLFWRLDMHPGKAVTAARLGPTVALALSGNPGAALLGFYLLVVPWLEAYFGWPPQHRLVRGRLAVPYPKPTRETRYLKVRWQWSKTGERLLVPLSDQSSDAIRSFLEADGLAVIAHQSPPLAAGTELTAIVLPHPLCPVTG
jgi:molybdopterin molybdotransferase